MIDHTSHHVVAVPDLPVTVEVPLLVPPSAAAGPAVLLVDDGSGPRRRAVQTHQTADLPDGAIGLPQTAYDLLGFGDDALRWSVHHEPVTDARSLVLELATECAPEQAVRQVASAALAGAVVLCSPGQGRLGGDASGEEHWVETGGTTYKIREVTGADAGHPLARITRHTDVRLYVPGLRAGVDMVILADISKSMEVDDIPVEGERGLFRRRSTTDYMQRIQALRQALLDLLAVRLQVSGRTSRVSLMAFNTMVFPKFPEHGGMVELDGSSPRQVVDAYRQAVETLDPFGGTRFEVALHAAAEVLHRHGHPRNEKLIVLVSDGAQWDPAKDSDTGRVFEALEEPVSLMAHLHRDLHVRLHAIGISTRELFLARDLGDHPSLIPDHRQLEQLVRVGGGDPASIGGLETLVDYFSAAGGGVTYQVHGPFGQAQPIQLSSAARSAIAAKSRSVVARGNQPGRSQLLEAMARANQRLEQAAPAHSEKPFLERQVVNLAASDLQALDAQGEALGRALARILAGLRPTGPGQALAGVQRWAQVVARLYEPVAGIPADLSALAALCGCRTTTADDLVPEVMVQLTAGLEALADWLCRTPPAAAQPGGPVGVAVAARRRRQLDRTDQTPVTAAGTDSAAGRQVAWPDAGSDGELVAVGAATQTPLSVKN